MKIKVLAAICGLLAAAYGQYNTCWWTPSILYKANEPGYTPGFWAFAYQTPATVSVQAGYSYYYTNILYTHTWYITKQGKTVEVDPGTLRGGSNVVAALTVSACGTDVKSIHATIKGYPVGYNEAHMTLQENVD